LYVFVCFIDGLDSILNYLQSGTLMLFTKRHTDVIYKAAHWCYLQSGTLMLE